MKTHSRTYIILCTYTCIQEHRLMHIHMHRKAYTQIHYNTCIRTHTHKSLTCMRTHSYMHACLFTATPRLVCGVFEDRVDSMKSKHDQSFDAMHTIRYTQCILSHTQKQVDTQNRHKQFIWIVEQCRSPGT